MVFGASMSGLLAARVLSGYYDTVTVVERDALPDGPVKRRGVPQGSHAHLLLARGAEILDSLFPGFLVELAAAGVPVWDGDLAKRDVRVGTHKLPGMGRCAVPCRTTTRVVCSWKIVCAGGCLPYRTSPCWPAMNSWN